MTQSFSREKNSKDFSPDIGYVLIKSRSEKLALAKFAFLTPMLPDWFPFFIWLCSKRVLESVLRKLGLLQSLTHLWVSSQFALSRFCPTVPGRGWGQIMGSCWLHSHVRSVWLFPGTQVSGSPPPNALAFGAGCPGSHRSTSVGRWMLNFSFLKGMQKEGHLMIPWCCYPKVIYLKVLWKCKYWALLLSRVYCQWFTPCLRMHVNNISVLAIFPIFPFILAI